MKWSKKRKIPIIRLNIDLFSAADLSAEILGAGTKLNFIAKPFRHCHSYGAMEAIIFQFTHRNFKEGGHIFFLPCRQAGCFFSGIYPELDSGSRKENGIIQNLLPYNMSVVVRRTKPDGNQIPGLLNECLWQSPSDSMTTRDDNKHMPV